MFGRVSMRKYGFAILFLLVLVTPFILRRTFGTTTPAPPVNHHAVPLLIITPNGEGIRREFKEAFSAWHEQKYGAPVNVQFVLFGGASDIVKYFQANQAMYQQLGTYHVDLAWGGGDFLFDQQLKKPGYLQPLELEPALLKKTYPKPDLGGLPLYDTAKPPSWFGVAVSSFGICYNKDVVRYLGVPEPKTWRDLADPRYAGWIVLADPTRSSSAKAAFLAVIQRAMADAATAHRSEDDGWADGIGLLRLISANCRVFTDGSGIVPNIISSGDVAAGMTIDFYARSQQDAVGSARMGYVEPVNATVVNPDPVAMIKGAEHHDTAMHFIEFLLSEDGQRIWKQKPGTDGGPRSTAMWRQPVMPSIYELPPAILTDTINPFHAASDFNQKASRMKTFGILGELLQFSCMDLLDELHQTRAIIQQHHRDDLDKKLGTFPFNQVEALARMKQWTDSNAMQKLELGRKWTEEFREEYRQLREAAEK